MPKFKENFIEGNIRNIEGNICDLEKERFFFGRVFIKNGKISEIEEISEENPSLNYVLPGFIDSHCHIESSFLSPSLFASLAVSHGTVSVVADCHEIANVLGEKGISWMLKSVKFLPFNFFWALPSCVPATKFENIPNSIWPKEAEKFLRKKEFVALGEVMDFPAVISREKEIFKKIKIAKKFKKRVDGHCPGLSGDELRKYIGAGISTDHESASLEEAKEKQELGVLIQIREGSAAKNLKDLIGLDYSRACLVTDDLEVKDLISGHLNEVVKKAVKLGVPFFKAVKMATKIPAEHYHLNSGEIKTGRYADLAEFKSLNNLKPEKVWIGGRLVFKSGKVLFPLKTLNLKTAIIKRKDLEKDLTIKAEREKVKIRAIEIVPGQILTKERVVEMNAKNGKLESDFKNDLLKIAVINRYGRRDIGLGFVKGFGLKEGAFASSVSHDSHNLICIGSNNKDMAKAVNYLCQKGGFVFVNKNKVFRVKLPLAGLMSNQNPKELEKDINRLEKALKSAGCRLKNPFSAISFLALLVIPEIKISDRGIFDVRKFQFEKLII